MEAAYIPVVPPLIYSISAMYISDVADQAVHAGLSQSGKNVWKMKFFPGQGKVREFCGWPGKFRKDLESQEI